MMNLCKPYLLGADIRRVPSLKGMKKTIDFLVLEFWDYVFVLKISK
jgi:hypothetical protein